MKLTPNKNSTYTLHLSESSAITLEATWVDYLRIVSYEVRRLHSHNDISEAF